MAATCTHAIYIHVDVHPTGPAAGTEDERGMREMNTDDEPQVGRDTCVPATNDGSPIQVQLDDVDDLPDVNSAEAANISSIR